MNTALRMSAALLLCLIAYTQNGPLGPGIGAAYAQNDAPTEPSEPSEPAEPAEPTPPTPTEPAQPATPQPIGSASGSTADLSLSHRFQVGIGIRAGSGYRIIAPYNEENCGQTQGEKVCKGLYPPWLEISPSFGVTDSLELLVDFRFFLDSPDFTSSSGLFIAPGLRYYADPMSMFKFFITAQLAFELQEQRAELNPDLASFDFGVRSALGLQIDVLRYLGLYVQGGLVLGFSRWFSMTADFAGGVQLRY